MENTANKGCKVVGCPINKHYSHGFCRIHYVRFKKGFDMDKPIRTIFMSKTGFCSVAGCKNKHISKGFCHAHYYRKKHGLDLKTPIKRVKGGTINDAGYKLVYVRERKKQILEHRVIMEKFIKRKLNRLDVVHHKNGIKNDNRIENLEIIPWGQHTSIHHKGIPKISMRGRKKNRHTGKFL